MNIVWICAYIWFLAAFKNKFFMLCEYDYSKFIELISKFKRPELLSIWCFSGLSQNKDIEKNSQFYCLLLCVILANRRRQRHPTPVLLPGEFHGWRSLVGCSPWGREESDTTDWLHFHFSLSCIGKGNGNPLQCSCLENPRDGGAWWAAVYGVSQSQTRLKRLSSSSNVWMHHNWLIYLSTERLGLFPIFADYE